jgi:hypothetical protein
MKNKLSYLLDAFFLLSSLRQLKRLNAVVSEEYHNLVMKCVNINASMSFFVGTHCDNIIKRISLNLLDTVQRGLP